MFLGRLSCPTRNRAGLSRGSCVNSNLLDTDLGIERFKAGKVLTGMVKTHANGTQSTQPSGFATNTRLRVILVTQQAG